MCREAAPRPAATNASSPAFLTASRAAPLWGPPGAGTVGTSPLSLLPGYQVLASICQREEHVNAWRQCVTGTGDE